MAIEFVFGDTDLGIDDAGRIYNGSLRKLTPFKDSDGYLKYKHKEVEYFLHELVYKHFVGAIGVNQYVVFKDGDKDNISATNLSLKTETYINASRQDTYYDKFRTEFLRRNPHIHKAILEHSKPEEIAVAPMDVATVETEDEKEELPEPDPQEESVDEVINAMTEEDPKKPEPDPLLGYRLDELTDGMEIERDIYLRTLGRIVREDEITELEVIKILREKGITSNGVNPHHTHIANAKRSGYI